MLGARVARLGWQRAAAYMRGTAGASLAGQRARPAGAAVVRRAVHTARARRCAAPPQPPKPSPLAPGGGAKPLPQGASGQATSATGKKAAVAGVLLGLASYWGYILYESKQTPMEWFQTTWEAAQASFQDAADPTEEFIRNSLQPLSLVRQQGLNGTVILNLEGTLLCRKWDRKHGYRYSKRPGMDELLVKLSQAGFEILLFSDLPTNVAMESVNSLLNSFPPGTISMNGLLAREHMFFRDGHYVKRLNYLPRDMNKVVLVDHSAESYKWNPNNTLLVKPYEEFDASDDTMRKVTQMIMTMRESGKPYQRFMSTYARPTKKPDGTWEPSTDAVEKFHAEQQRKLKEHFRKKTSGVSGALRRMKGASNNLKKSKVISAGALSVNDIMTTQPTDVDKKPETLWERKMAKLHKRQREWEKQTRLAQAAAMEEEQKKG